jgi:cytochrome c-type biogenesis protein CcmE
MADLYVKQRLYLVILCVSKLGNNKQMVPNSVKSHRILFFVASFHKKALRKSQNQLRVGRFSMNMTLIDRLQLQTCHIIFVEFNQSLMHITV